MKGTYFLLLFVLFVGQAIGFTGTPDGYGQTKSLSDSPGMSAEGTKYMLGAEEIDGVKGVVYLNDVRKKMAEHGLKQTHHIMISFVDVNSGAAIESGSVAVKVEAPDEKVMDAISLLSMDGDFGADITLNKKGLYHFQLGTKLADGKKRIFHYHFENK